jgi:hypothetical protein
MRLARTGPLAQGGPSSYGTEGREFESLRARSPCRRFSPFFAVTASEAAI